MVLPESYWNLGAFTVNAGGAPADRGCWPTSSPVTIMRWVEAHHGLHVVSVISFREGVASGWSGTGATTPRSVGSTMNGSRSSR